ncbi:MAG TPA: hypothetical protein PKE47_00660 [Verrucomicrobiota bacterium]|nr:hypothetical protein [Verrucomicrobiota bacterium]
MLAIPPPPTPAGPYAAKAPSLRRELREEYLQPHDHPWILGFSGGKDSTLLLHFVLEAVRNIAPDERRRPIFVVSNDTLVESPVFQAFVDRLLARLEESLAGLNVPLKVVRTHPLPEESFWVNLLALQAETGQPLISDHEVRLIREQWAKDQTQEVLWEVAA